MHEFDPHLAAVHGTDTLLHFYMLPECVTSQQIFRLVIVKTLFSENSLN
jgi:hypothetical protein